MDDVEDFVECVDWCSGIDNHGRFASVRTDEMEGAIEVDAGFLMHGNPGGASPGEGFDEVVGIFDHQVTIERDVADGFAQRGDHRRADGDVGDEMAVHDVDMEDGAAGVDGGLGLDAELGEVGGEDGGCEFDQLALLTSPKRLDDSIIPEDAFAGCEMGPSRYCGRLSKKITASFFQGTRGTVAISFWTELSVGF